MVTGVRSLRRDRGGGRGIQRGGRERGGNPSRGARISLSLFVCSRPRARSWPSSGGPVRSGPASGESVSSAGGGGGWRILIFCGARGDFGVGRRPDLGPSRAAVLRLLLPLPLPCPALPLEKSENGWAEEEGLSSLFYRIHSEPSQPTAVRHLSAAWLGFTSLHLTLLFFPRPSTAQLPSARPRAVAGIERASQAPPRERERTCRPRVLREEGSGEEKPPHIHIHSGQGGLVTPRDPCARPRRTGTLACAPRRRVGPPYPWSRVISHVTRGCLRARERQCCAGRNEKRRRRGGKRELYLRKT